MILSLVMTLIASASTTAHDAYRERLLARIHAANAQVHHTSPLVYVPGARAHRRALREGCVWVQVFSDAGSSLRIECRD